LRASGRFRKALGVIEFGDFARHRPRRRAIQYAETFPLKNKRLGLLARPVEPGDDSFICSYSGSSSGP
jgi:hypothetical protein